MPVAKHYVGAAAAGAISRRIASAVADRIGLVIQNTGLNPGNIRFENENNPANGGDFTLVPGEFLHFPIPETCPREAVNIISELGTTFSILETVKDR